MTFDLYETTLILAMAATATAVHLAGGDRSPGSGGCAEPGILCFLRDDVEVSNPLPGLVAIGRDGVPVEVVNLPARN
jgi:hypothetical protein